MYIVNNTGDIYTHAEFVDYIESQGFDINDVKNIVLNNGEQEKVIEKIKSLEDKADDYERLADGYYNDMVTAVNELEVIMEKLRQGKGLTKAQAADKIKCVIDYYLQG